MDWLTAYDAGTTRRDFGRARSAGFDSLRVFVRWSDIQPSSSTIDDQVLARLVDSADAASEAGVNLIITLFVGLWGTTNSSGRSTGHSRRRESL